VHEAKEKNPNLNIFCALLAVPRWCLGRFPLPSS